MLDFRHILPLRKLLPLVAFLALGLYVFPADAGPAGTDLSLIAGNLASHNAEERSYGLATLQAAGQDAMPDLLRTLSAGSVPERRGSVIGLALLPVPGLAVDGLLNALADKDATVRSLAAHALGKIGAPVAPAVAEKLADADNRVRVAAALSLSKMGSAAVPSLARLLQREDPMVRAKAAWILGAMGQDALAAVPALIRALETEDIRLVHVVAEAIDTIGPDPVLVYIELTLLGRERINCPVTRIGAAAAPTLVKLLARPGTPLGNVALYALARMGPVAEPALRTILSTGTEGQRAAAALLLTGIDPKLVHTLPEDLRRTLAGAMNTN